MHVLVVGWAIALVISHSKFLPHAVFTTLSVSLSFSSLFFFPPLLPSSSSSSSFNFPSVPCRGVGIRAEHWCYLSTFSTEAEVSQGVKMFDLGLGGSDYRTRRHFVSLSKLATEPSTLQLTSTVLTNEWCINLKAMNAALDNIFSAKQHKYNTYLKKKKSLNPGTLIHLHLSEHGVLLPVVTFTWTRPTQTQEIVLPPASPHIICVIQCVGVTEGSSSMQPADCSPHPHRKAWLQTFTYHSPLKWPQVCTWQVCTHTYAKKPLCPHLSAVRTVSHTHTHTHTQELTAHCVPAPANPPPCSKQPPSGLVRANPAVDSAAPIAAPPPLRVVREMKALGVHYKTTAAAAGDRPPGAANYPFSSFHPHLFPLCPSISQPRSTLLPATHSTLSSVPQLCRDEWGFLKKKKKKSTAFMLSEVKYWSAIL